MRVRRLLHTLRPPAADVALAAAVVALGLGEVWFLAEVDRGPATVGAVVMGSALAWRRRLPVAACVTAVWTQLVVAQLGVPVDSWVFVLLVFVLALYAMGAYASIWRSVFGVAATFVAATLSVFANEGPGLDNLGFGLVMVGGPWLAGRFVRRRTDQAVALALRAQELEQGQAEREQAAVAAERARIARELHDIVAHSVSVMTIQAGAIEEVVDVDPARARAAAGSIRQTGRQALTDLRRLLGLLREPTDGQALLPQPGLDDLDGLVDQVRGAGLDVRLAVEGPRRALPAAVDLSAYRVVQEALTNTLKHARASSAVVRIRYTPEALDIEVTDDGVAPAASANGGHGLIGMRERIGLYDGRLEFGRGPTGGFRVHALLPLAGEVA